MTFSRLPLPCMSQRPAERHLILAENPMAPNPQAPNPQALNPMAQILLAQILLVQMCLAHMHLPRKQATMFSRLAVLGPPLPHPPLHLTVPSAGRGNHPILPRRRKGTTNTVPQPGDLYFCSAKYTLVLCYQFSSSLDRSLG